jgi:D-sedoheptulose 7-phosphate isomerase
MNKLITEELELHKKVLDQTISDTSQTISNFVDKLADCFRTGHKLLICGNGGSAADAQHLAAEFINRFRFDHPALPAIALTTDTSILTAIGNDSSFDYVFSRQVEALAVEGDILIGISTSGKSVNVLQALEAARNKGVTTAGFTGEKGRTILGSKCDFCFIVPSTDTARTQECHEFLYHVICGLVEQSLFGQK